MSKKIETYICQKCLVLVPRGSSCMFCNTYENNIGNQEELKKEKRITKVFISGTNNDVKIKYKKDTYVPEIRVSGVNQEFTFHTDSDIDLSLSGVNNDVVVKGLSIISRDISGVNLDVKQKRRKD